MKQVELIIEAKDVSSSGITMSQEIDVYACYS